MIYYNVSRREILEILVRYQLRKEGGRNLEERSSSPIREEVFDGTLEECLAHYAARLLEIAPKTSRRFSELKEPMAEFCEVATDTVAEWLFRTRMPSGVKLIKLTIFLNMIGYHVDELARIKTPAIRGLNEIIGYGVLTPEAVSSQTGYNNASELYRVLSGRASALSEKEHKILALFVSKRKELEEKKLEYTKKYGNGILRTQEGELSSTQKAVVHQMEALLDLLESGTLLTVNPNIFKRVGGAETLYKLSTRLATLSVRLNPQKTEVSHE